MYEYELFVNTIKIIVLHILKLCKSRDDKKMFLPFSLSLNVYVCPSFYNLLYEHAPQWIHTVWNCCTILSKNNKLYVEALQSGKYTCFIKSPTICTYIQCSVQYRPQSIQKAYFPVVRFVSPRPPHTLTRKRVLLLPLSHRGRHTRGR